MPHYMCLLQQSLIIKQQLHGADLEQSKHLNLLTWVQRNAKHQQYHLLMANLYLIALLKELNM